jgi:Na+/melibiose symporter-like transporter
VTNISTLLIYGALYVYGYFSTLFLQGTLGYTAAAAGLSGIAVSIALTLLSTRFGSWAARIGPRRFMAIGPALMGVAILWLVRLPATSTAWVLRPRSPETFVPPVAFFVDLLPTSILFGIGLAVMVAPLTTALMSSVPVRNSGLASAINNAVSRVGPQLAGAVIFIAITATFYSGLASRVPGLDTSDAETRRRIPPLNRPDASVPPEVATAARTASGESFHLAMLVVAGLLFAGAAVNAVGIRDDDLRTESAAGVPAAAGGKA